MPRIASVSSHKQELIRLNHKHPYSHGDRPEHKPARLARAVNQWDEQAEQPPNNALCHVRHPLL
jgi:hypothetical protein